MSDPNPPPPPTYEQSLYVASSSRRPSSRKKKSTQGIGGDVVGSMKRGLQVDQRSGKRKEGRLKVLLGIAGLLFIILTTIWVIRLNKRIVDKGGWSNLYRVISQRISSSTSPIIDKQEL